MFNNNETMTLGRARILSSENDASVSQNTNVNIRIARQPSTTTYRAPSEAPTYRAPSEAPTYRAPSIPSPPSVNFTQPLSEHQATTSPSQFVQDRGIIDMANELDDLTIKNKFLETLLSIYEVNPLRYNGYLVCHSSSLMELIKILTNADKVELVIDEESGCTGCISNAKYMNIQRILITKDDKSLELKYGYNNVYAQLVKYGISLKLCV